MRWTRSYTTTILAVAVAAVLHDTAHIAVLFPSSLHISAFQPVGRSFRSFSGRLRREMVFYVPEDAPILVEKSTQSVLDTILDDSLRVSARSPIMRQFDPSSQAIWWHWKGTIFSETWKTALTQVLWTSAVYLIGRQPQFAGLLESMKGFTNIWGQLLSISTFTLTFFVNQTYALFRSILTIARTLQGRCNDVMMAVAVSAQRVEPTSNAEAHLEVSQYTEASRDLLMTLARYVRLFHILSYASFTRSHRPLLTPQGMRRMVDRGLITPKERKVLVEAAVDATQKHNIVILWVLRLIYEGRKSGILEGGPGLDRQTVSKVQDIRAQANYIECELGGRMPFAYAHMVQVLVDSVVFLYPLTALIAGLPFYLGAVGSAMITICFRGLFDLSKQFLDPFHNENFWKGEDPLMVNTFLAETNAGSLRWVNGLDAFPIPSRHLNTDEMKQYVLPDQGYTVEEGNAYRAARKKIEAVEQAKEATELTKEEFEEKAAKIIEEAQVEFVETQRILLTPPGSSSDIDFELTPEDDMNSFGNHTAIGTFESTGDQLKEWQGQRRDDNFDLFRDAAEEEYGEVIMGGPVVDEDSGG
jgi:hypothetical protein